MNRSTLLSLSLAVFTPCLSAQTVVMVPPGADVQAAIAAAQPGDILQLADTFYDAFEVNKGVTIAGPASILSNPMGGGLAGLEVQVPMGQHAVLTDLVFDYFAFPFFIGNVTVFGGLVSFDHCEMRGTVDLRGGHVTLNACTMTQGVIARDTDLVMTSSMAASPASPSGLRDGVRVEAGVGRVYISDCVLVGADATSSFQYGGYGLTTQVPTRVTDSTVVSGDTFAPPPMGLAGTPAVEGVDVLVARTSLQAGAGTGPVPLVLGNVLVEQNLVGLSAGRAEIGQPLELFATGRFGGPPLFAISTELAPPLFDPQILLDPFWLAGTVVTLAGESPAMDRSRLAFTVPNDPALRLRSFYVAATPAVFGLVRLSPVVPIVIH